VPLPGSGTPFSSLEVLVAGLTDVVFVCSSVGGKSRNSLSQAGINWPMGAVCARMENSLWLLRSSGSSEE
jgi:hypothetical protein